MPEISEADDAEYHISSFSTNGACVAVARLSNGDYVVRHSRDTGPPLVFTRDEWVAFVTGVKAAEFDF